MMRARRSNTTELMRGDTDGPPQNLGAQHRDPSQGGEATNQHGRRLAMMSGIGDHPRSHGVSTDVAGSLLPISTERLTAQGPPALIEKRGPGTEVEVSGLIIVRACSSVSVKVVHLLVVVLRHRHESTSENNSV